MNITTHCTKIHLISLKDLYATSRRTAYVDSILEGVQRDGMELHSFTHEQEAGVSLGIKCCVTTKPKLLVARFSMNNTRVKMLKVIF
jgi:hypothetical protein